MLVLCDFARLGTPDAVYDYLSEELQLPPYFGRNLDALHDCLILTGASSPCGEHFVRVFKDAARRNKYLSVEIHEG